MLNGNDWITTIITEAKKDKPFLTKSVLTRLDDLLRSKLTKKQLSQTELATIAKQLITDMIPPLQEEEVKQ